MLLVIIVILLALIVPNIRIVPQQRVYVIERLGKYQDSWEAGIHIKIPVLDRIVRKISLKEQVLDFPPQPVITKDNVTMRIDSVVFAKVFDPKLYTYGVEDPIFGLQNLSATTLRNIIGDMELDQTLTSRDEINGRLQTILDEATDPWGLKVTRVELKNITPPKEIEDVMTTQMRAERERRQTVLEAQAHQESVVSRAEGDKRAKILAAEAERESQIALAEGRAQSIKLVYEAEAEGLRMLNEACPNESVLKLKSIDALKNVSDGKATKIYMPTDIMNSIASLGVLSDAMGLSKDVPAASTGKAGAAGAASACATGAKATLTAEEKLNALMDQLDDPCLSDASSTETIRSAESNYKMQQSLERKPH